MLIVAKRSIKYPVALEREYAKTIVAHVKRNIAKIKEYIPEMVSMIEQNRVRVDDINSDLDYFMDNLRNLLERGELLIGKVKRMYDRVKSWASAEWNAITRKLFGSPFKPNMGKVNVENSFETLQQIWVQENLNYIKSIDDEIMSKIRNELASAIISNVNSASLVKQLSEKISEIARVDINRATLIGADQVGKLNSKIAQYNQQNAGITQYKWSTSRDERVRPWHATRDGKIFNWDKPPSDGHPGMPIRCRCVALPVFDTDKIIVQPIKNSYSVADVVGETAKQNSNGNIVMINGIKVGALTDNEEKTEAARLIRKYFTAENVIIDEAIDSPYRYNGEKILVNPKHINFAKYNFMQSSIHEIVHMLDDEYSIAIQNIGKVHEAIISAKKEILANKDMYINILSGELGDNIMFSDLMAAITKNKIHGSFAHGKGYWQITGMIEKEFVANLLGVKYTNNETALKVIEGITPLADVLRELDAYVHRYAT